MTKKTKTIKRKTGDKELSEPSVLSELYAQIAMNVFKARAYGAPLWFIQLILGNQGGDYKPVYDCFTHGGRLLNDLNGKNEYDAQPRGGASRDDQAISKLIPHPLAAEMARKSISIRKWAWFYGRDWKNVVISLVDGTISDQTLELLHNDFPETYGVGEVDRSPLKKYAIHFMKPEFKTIKGIAKVSVSIVNIPEIRAYGPGGADYQKSNCRLLFCRTVQRERLKAFTNVAECALADRYESVRKWELESLFRNYEWTYTKPAWIQKFEAWEVQSKYLEKQLANAQSEYYAASESRDVDGMEKWGEVFKEAEKALNDFETQIERPLEIVFSKEDTIVFFKKYVEGRNYDELYAIAEVLSYLEEYGNKPSIVDNYRLGKKGKGYDSSDYPTLKNISIYQHSLRVARESIRNSSTSGCHNIRGRFILTALAHDLGKIPGHYSREYKTEDHPGSSVKMLNAMWFFPQLKSKDIPKNNYGKPIGNDIKDVVKFAVLNHHIELHRLDPRHPDTLLLTALRAADHEARRIENGESPELPLQ